jgi:hypothetical protein
MTPEEKADAMNKLTEWRKKEIIAHSMPGERVGGERWHDFMAASGASRLVETRPLFDHHGNRLPNHVGTFHVGGSDNLGVVGSNWGLVQNEDAFSGVKTLHDSNAISVEAVEQRKGGAVTTLTGLLGFSQVNADSADNVDNLGHFVRASNGFTGADSYSFEAYTLRLVCLNGMTSMTKTQSIKIKHTSRAEYRIKQSQRAIVRLIEAEKAEAEQFAELSLVSMNADQFVEFSCELFDDVRGKADTDRKRTRREKDITELLEFFEHGRGNHGENRYDGYNAITEWLTPRQERYEDAVKFARDFANNASEGQAARVRNRAFRMLTRS